MISVVSKAKALATVSQRGPSIRCALGVPTGVNGVILHHLVLAQSSTHHIGGVWEHLTANSEAKKSGVGSTCRPSDPGPNTATMREGEPTAIPMREGQGVCLR